MVCIIGGLLSAFIFTLVYGTLSNLGIFRTLDYGKITLFKISDNYESVLSFGYLGLIFSGILLMILSFILPNKKTT